jgi:hypothetical protein
MNQEQPSDYRNARNLPNHNYNVQVDASIGSATLTVGGLDTVMAFLGNLSYIVICVVRHRYLGAFMEPASCRAIPFLPKVLIRHVLPQVCDHSIVVFASDGFYNFVRKERVARLGSRAIQT